MLFCIFSLRFYISFIIDALYIKQGYREGCLRAFCLVPCSLSPLASSLKINYDHFFLSGSARKICVLIHSPNNSWKSGRLFGMYELKENFIHMIWIMLSTDWTCDRRGTFQMWNFCVTIELVQILEQFYLPFNIFVRGEALICDFSLLNCNAWI